LRPLRRAHAQTSRSFWFRSLMEPSGRPRYYHTPEEADRIAEELWRTAPITEGEYIVQLVAILPKETRFEDVFRIDPHN